MTAAALVEVGVGIIVASAMVAMIHQVRLAYLVQAVGVAGVGLAGVMVVAGGASIGSEFTSSMRPAVGIDPLTGSFLALLAVAAVPTLVAAAGMVERRAAGSDVGIAVLTAGFLLALTGFLMARDAVSMLAAWELMTLLPAAAILVYQRSDKVRRTVLVYLSMTHIAGVGTWLALLLLSHYGALGGAEELDPQVVAVVMGLAVVGFGTKAGMYPVHGWLPGAHPAAPFHVSALMSGVMLKVALYGLIRVASWMPAIPAWLAICVLGLAVLSAVGGAFRALTQRDLKRLLAYSSIENIGIALIGIAASWLLAGSGKDSWATIALAAALLHMFNHSIFKSLLFVGAGVMQRHAGGTDIDHLGGLMRSMPFTAWSILLGCGAIAGLPLLNGFVSEWMILQALVHGITVGGGGDSIALTVAVAFVALTIGLAMLCFVLLPGIVLLGSPRTRAAADAQEPPQLVRVGLGAHALLCVVLGLAPGIVARAAGDVASRVTGTSASIEVVPLTVPGAQLPIAPLAGLMIVVTAILFVLRRRAMSPGTTPVWACGQNPSDRALAWTSRGFSTTLQLMVPTVPARNAMVTARGRSRHVGTVITRRARRLQSGSLSTYIAYLIATSIIVLALLRIDVLT